jgi:hypothetical protein
LAFEIESIRGTSMETAYETVKYVVWPFNYSVFIGACLGLTAVSAALSKRYLPSLVLGLSGPPSMFWVLVAPQYLANAGDWRMGDLYLLSLVVGAAGLFWAATLLSGYSLISGTRLYAPTALLYGLAAAHVLLNSFVLHMLLLGE